MVYIYIYMTSKMWEYHLTMLISPWSYNGGYSTSHPKLTNEASHRPWKCWWSTTVVGPYHLCISWRCYPLWVYSCEKWFLDSLTRTQMPDFDGYVRYICMLSLFQCLVYHLSAQSIGLITWSHLVFACLVSWSWSSMMEHLFSQSVAHDVGLLEEVLWSSVWLLDGTQWSS